ncbi:MAG: response regulator transcription factor [Roseivirga sp.]|nr:response regulator transcription factor [Roseivirga sp.]
MEYKLTTVAVDDEFRALEVIERYASKITFLDLVKTFNTPLEALTFIEEENIDLIFLDINMPVLSGTSLARLVNSKVQIIFTTAYSEHAVEGFELEATDYLLKPIEFERFLNACLKAKNRFDQSKHLPITPDSEFRQKILISTKGKIFQIDRDDFLFAEKSGNDMYFRLNSNRTLKCRMSIKELLIQLPENCYQIHKSFIVSLDKIDLLEKNQILINHHKIPIGRVFKRELMEKLKSA